MASLIINIERWQGTNMAFVRSRANDTPETEETYKDVLRSIDYNIFRDTLIPAEHRIRAGALTALLLLCPERNVLCVELRRFEGVGVWVADALVDDGDQVLYRRGTGATPVDALTALAVEIHEY